VKELCCLEAVSEFIGGAAPRVIAFISSSQSQGLTVLFSLIITAFVVVNECGCENSICSSPWVF
jgi:hypothetical protein